MSIEAPPPSPRRPPLRVWPAVIAVALLWLVRFGTKLVIPGFQGFSQGMQVSFILAGLILLWWLFFSRAPWLDRIGGLVVLAGSIAAAWALKHESMGPLWLVGYALPVVFLAFVGSAVAMRRSADGRRRLVMAGCVFLAAGGWALARTDGIDGDHDASFAWRWSQTAEQRLLHGGNDAPAAPISIPPEDVNAAWPGFRGPHRDGNVHQTNIATDWASTPPEELWRRPVGPGWSSFALHGDFLYTQEQRGDDEAVSCYRATTGAPVWRHLDPARFFESNGGAGPRGTPTLHGGRVFAFGATGILNALDAADGSVVWSTNVAADADVEVPTWGFSSSPLIIDDLVIVAAAGRLVAYDLTDGSLGWTGPDGGVSYSSPHSVTFDGTPQIVLLSQAGPSGFSPTDGKQLWEYPWSGFPMIQPALTADGQLLVNAGESSGIRRLAISREAEGWTVQERWQSSGLKPYFNGFVVHEGHAFGFDRRILSCIDLETGTRKWKGGRYGSGQLVLLADQDQLLVLSERGELALVEARSEGFNELARFPAIKGKTWNHPVLVKDLLLVRNSSEMAAFRLPAAAVSDE